MVGCRIVNARTGVQFPSMAPRQMLAWDYIYQTKHLSHYLVAYLWGVGRNGFSNNSYKVVKRAQSPASPPDTETELEQVWLLQWSEKPPNAVRSREVPPYKGNLPELHMRAGT